MSCRSTSIARTSFDARTAFSAVQVHLWWIDFFLPPQIWEPEPCSFPSPWLLHARSFPSPVGTSKMNALVNKGLNWRWSLSNRSSRICKSYSLLIIWFVDSSSALAVLIPSSSKMSLSTNVDVSLLIETFKSAMHLFASRTDLSCCSRLEWDYDETYPIVSSWEYR